MFKYIFVTYTVLLIDKSLKMKYETCMIKFPLVFKDATTNFYIHVYYM